MNYFIYCERNNISINDEFSIACLSQRNTDDFEEAEKVAADASRLHLTAFKRGVGKRFWNANGRETDRLHNLRCSPRVENTDVITNFLSRKRKLLLLLIADNFLLAKYEYFHLIHFFSARQYCDENWLTR